VGRRPREANKDVARKLIREPNAQRIVDVLLHFKNRGSATPEAQWGRRGWL
jgi:hypothetical protein